METDHNIRLAGDTPTAKLKNAAVRLKKILNDRTWIQSSLTNLIKHEKEKGRNPKAIRAAIRFDKMTPEKRDKWCEDNKAALELFGFTIEQLPDDPPDWGDEWAAVETARTIQAQIREVDREKRELREACKLEGIDFAALQTVVRMQIRNEEHEDVEERQEKVDAYGVALGLW